MEGKESLKGKVEKKEGHRYAFFFPACTARRGEGGEGLENRRGRAFLCNLSLNGTRSKERKGKHKGRESCPFLLLSCFWQPTDV